MVAEAGSASRDEVAARYAELFGLAMAGNATCGRHTNALLHAFSQVSDRLDDTRRTDLVDRIHACRRLEVAEESVGDRARAVRAGAAALDQHREGQVAAVTDEPAV